MQRGAEEQQAFDSVAVGGVDHVGLDDQVVVDEVRGIGVVGQDAADLGRREKDEVRTLPRRRSASTAISSVRSSSSWVRNSRLLKSQPIAARDNGGTHQAAMAGNEDAAVFP